jgi:hypothetical protein
LLPEPTIAREVESGTLVKVPLGDAVLARPLGIIHRRDRKLNETAQQFIRLLQAQSGSIVANEAQTSAVVSTSNGHAVRQRTPAGAGVE